MAEQTGGGNNETTILATFKDQTAEGMSKLQERLKGLRGDAQKAGAAMGDIGKGANGSNGIAQATRTITDIAKAITLTTLGIKGLSAAVYGTSAFFKNLRGDVQGAKDDVRAFARELESVIRSLPGGDVIAATGNSIDSKMEDMGKQAGLKFSVGYRKTIAFLLKKVPNPFSEDSIDAFGGGEARKTRSELEAENLKKDAELKAKEERDKRGVAAIETANTQFGSRFGLADIDQQIIKLRDQREKLEQEVGQNLLLRDKTGETTEAGAKLQRSLLQLDKDIEVLKQQRDHAVEQQKTLLDVERAKLVDDHGSDLEALALLGEKQRQEREAYVKQFGGKGVEDLDARQGLEKVNTQIGLAADRAHGAESKLNEKLAQTAHLVETGSISIFEADRRTAAAQKEYAASIDKTRDALVEMQAVATDPGVTRALQRQIDMLPPHVSEIRKEINKLGGEIRDSLQSPTEGFFKGIITGSVSAKQAFKNMITGFADNLATLAANKLATATLSGIFGGGAGSGAGGGFGGLIEGAFTKKNAGGWIPGGGPDRDSIPAMLTPGEFVVSRRAAQMYPRLLEAINSGHAESNPGRIYSRMMSIANPSPQHFNTGGMVAPADAGSFRGGGGAEVRLVPGLVLTAAEGRKIVAASQDAIFELLNRHPDRLPRGG